MYYWLSLLRRLTNPKIFMAREVGKTEQVISFTHLMIPSPADLFSDVLPPKSAPEKVHHFIDSVPRKPESQIYCPKSLLLLSGGLQLKCHLTANGGISTKPNIVSSVPKSQSSLSAGESQESCYFQNSMINETLTPTIFGWVSAPKNWYRSGSLHKKKFSIPVSGSRTGGKSDFSELFIKREQWTSRSGNG